MADATGTNTVTLETATGSIELPAGLPDWATQILLDEANASLAPQPTAQPAIGDAGGAQSSAAAGGTGDSGNAPAGSAPAQGYYIDTGYGLVYVAPGMPDWVVRDLIQQTIDANKGFIPPAPVPTTAPGPQPTNRPAAVALPAPTAQNLHPVGAPNVANPPAGLGAAVATVRDVAGNVASRIGDVIGGAAQGVDAIVGRILEETGTLVKAILPTVEQLAVGLTSRVADVLSFIGDKVVDVETYAMTMATHAAEALGVVLEDSWQWIARGILAMLAVFTAPLADVRSRLLSHGLGPVLA